MKIGVNYAPHSFGAGIDFLEVVEQVEAWGVDSLFVAPGTGPFGPTCQNA